MALDIQFLKEEFVKIIRKAVGDRLYKDPKSGYSAIVIARPDSPYPHYPYILVDQLDITDEGSWSVGEEINEDCEVELFINKQILFSFRCYGEESVSIMNSLSNYLKLDRVRAEIRDTLKGSIVEVLDNDTVPVSVGDRYLESAAVNLIFNIQDSVVDPEAGYFNNINLDGEVSRDVLDTNPYTINIDVS